MVHRGIATLAGALMVCFFLLTAYDAQFFYLHFYQATIYLAIILMLFYLEDRYAYMLGITVPAFWLLLNYGTGILPGAWRQVSGLVTTFTISNGATFIAAIIAVLAVLMIGFCAYRFKREFAGTGKTGKTVAVSVAITIVYYAGLIFWFWESIPQTPGG